MIFLTENLFRRKKLLNRKILEKNSMKIKLINKFVKMYFKNIKTSETLLV